MIEQQIKSTIRDIPDFPRPGILFRDITPVLQDPVLCRSIVSSFAERAEELRADVVAGVESRGFLFGMLLAQELQLPFVPVRKEGKLPYRTMRQSYELEYGNAVVEVHEDAVRPGQRVLIHDDLLATGGTISAVSELVNGLGAKIAGYCFLVELRLLNGRTKLTPYSFNIHSLAVYD